VNALTDIGDSGTALTHGWEALDGFHRALGLDHPHTLGCAASVTVVLSALGHEQDAAALRADTLERYARTLGYDHPDVQLFVAGHQFEADFTPLPL
jgi:Tetratricopeptide repeat